MPIIAFDINDSKTKIFATFTKNGQGPLMFDTAEEKLVTNVTIPYLILNTIFKKKIC